MKKIFPINRERYFGFIKAQTRRSILFTKSWPQQFSPFSPNAKNTDSCIIGNGIPKGGTYLINSIIEYLDKWENTRVHINPDHWYFVPIHGDISVNDCTPQFSVKKLRNGQMVAAHLPWSQVLEKSIEHVTPNRRIKHVLIYRDPRDTFVSYMNFVVYSKNFGVSPGAREYQRFMLENFSNDDERLTYIIKERRNYYFLRYEPWLRSSHCLAIKFEDLYPEMCNLKNNVIGKVLRGFLDYLEVDVNTVDLLDFYSKVYGKSPTASSEELKVERYKRVFREHHYALIDNPKFRNILYAFGYEW